MARSSPPQIPYRWNRTARIPSAYHPFGVHYGAQRRKMPVDRRASVAQTSWSEQTGGPISGVFAGGLAILLDTLFRRGDADIVVEKATREKTANEMARSDLSHLRSGWRLVVERVSQARAAHPAGVRSIRRITPYLSRDSVFFFFQSDRRVLAMRQCDSLSSRWSIERWSIAPILANAIHACIIIDISRGTIGFQRLE